MNRTRVAWIARHPVVAAGRLVRRIDRHPGLPVGRTARTRRLLREVIRDRGRALVIGPPHVVRQALSAASLDVVGTNPDDPSITVVSEARGATSLPRRWDCVVVTETDPPPGRLAAATGACLPGGVVVVIGRPSEEPAAAPDTEIEHRAVSRDVHVVVGRVP